MAILRARDAVTRELFEIEGDIVTRSIKTSGGGGGVGGGGDASASNQIIGNDRIGATDSAAATADTGTFNLNALTKRQLAHLTDLRGRWPSSLGQKLMAASLPVVVASDQTAIPVTLAAGASALGKPEDSVHVTADVGVMMLGVRNDVQGSLVDANGDYASLQLDSVGRLRTLADSTVTSIVPGTGASNLGKTEDAAHTSGDVGVMVLGIRNDAGTVLADTTGDYIPFSMDSTGAVRSAITSVAPGVAATSLGKAEDAVHASGDTGVMMLGVRRDIPTTLVSADGDYTPLIFDESNRLHVSVGASATTIGKIEDAVHASGDVGAFMLGVRNDADAIRTSADGDYGAISLTQEGWVKVRVMAGGAGGASGTEFAEDAVHTSGALGSLLLGVRKDAAGSLSDADGDYAVMQFDAQGALRVTGGGGGQQYAEDSVHASGDLGTMMMAVRSDGNVALAGANGDYIPLTTDSSGSVWTRITAIVPGAGSTNLGKAEDAAHASGDTGVMLLGVRNDADAALTSTDGDYTPLSVNSVGALKVSIASPIPAGAATIGTVNIGTMPTVQTGLGQVEDLTHTSGATGVMMLAVRQDTPINMVSAVGDYAPIQVNGSGFAYVTVASGSTSIGKAEDEAHLNGDVGVPSLMVRNSAGGSLTSADGDYEFLQSDNVGNLRVNVAASPVIGTLADTAATDETSSSSVIGVLKAVLREARSTAPVGVIGLSPVVDVQIVTDTIAYTAGDVISDSQVVTNAMRANDSTGSLTSLFITDKADQGVPMTVYFLSSNVSMGSVNGVPSITDANSMSILGFVDIAASDWKDLGGAKVARPSFAPFNLKPATGTRNIYIAIVNGSGAPTFAADSLFVRLSILLD